MSTPPTEAEILALINDDEVPDEELEQFFAWDERQGADWAGIEESLALLEGTGTLDDIPNLSTALEGVIGAFNARGRRRRSRRYVRRKDDGFDGITVVSEGDSWFQYPVKLRDTIDHLADRDDLNVLCLAAGGDWLSNMLQTAEYIDTLDREAPDVFLVSGGGNDLVGKERLTWVLRAFKEDKEPAWYLGRNFDQTIDDIRLLYTTLLDQVTARYPDLAVLTHGYDHAIPAGGEWLGAPMAAIGIEDPQLQRSIVKLMIDRVSDLHAELAQAYDNVHFVDCRGAVTHWHDELHPTSADYGKVADRFYGTILAALGKA